MTDHTTQQMGQNPIKYPVKSQFFDVEPRKRQPTTEHTNHRILAP
jgi:hypothetical protein